MRAAFLVLIYIVVAVMGAFAVGHGQSVGWIALAVAIVGLALRGSAIWVRRHQARRADASAASSAGGTGDDSTKNAAELTGLRKRRVKALGLAYILPILTSAIGAMVVGALAPEDWEFPGLAIGVALVIVAAVLALVVARTVHKLSEPADE